MCMHVMHVHLSALEIDVTPRNGCRDCMVGCPPHDTPGHCTKGTLFTSGLYFKVFLIRVGNGVKHCFLLRVPKTASLRFLQNKPVFPPNMCVHESHIHLSRLLSPPHTIAVLSGLIPSFKKPLLFKTCRLSTTKYAPKKKPPF